MPRGLPFNRGQGMETFTGKVIFWRRRTQTQDTKILAQKLKVKRKALAHVIDYIKSFQFLLGSEPFLIFTLSMAKTDKCKDYHTG